MKTRLVLLSLFTILSIPCLHGQEIIATDGAYQTSSQGSLSWSIGEPITETSINSSGIITQGFEQNYEDFLSTISLNLFDEFLIFPNPFNSELKISSPELTQGYSIQIFDQLGRVIFTEEISIVGVLNKTIDLSHLSNGSYTVSIRNKDVEHQFNHQVIKLN